MIIDFNEKRFITVVKEMVQPFGLSKSQVEQVVFSALTAVRKSSKPVKK